MPVKGGKVGRFRRRCAVCRRTFLGESNSKACGPRCAAALKAARDARRKAGRSLREAGYRLLSDEDRSILRRAGREARKGPKVIDERGRVVTAHEYALRLLKG